jgi:hypothetical protein
MSESKAPTAASVPDAWIVQAKTDLATLPAETWVRLYGARLVATAEGATDLLFKSAGMLREATTTSAAGWKLSNRLSELCIGLFRQLGWKPSEPWPKVTPKLWQTLQRFVLDVLTCRRQFFQEVASGLGERVAGVDPVKPGSGAERMDRAVAAVLVAEPNAELERLFARVRERAAEIQREAEEAAKVPREETN